MLQIQMNKMERLQKRVEITWPFKGWYALFLQNFALPNVELFNVLVPWDEFLVGLGLILGCLTAPALIAGTFMNLNFLLAGTVSTNSNLMTVAMILLLVGSASYYWGADRYVMLFIKKRLNKNDIQINRKIVMES
ncbi:hypothetical protein AB1471_13835 [Jeotgalibacillus marinus]|uniref:Uncharacterized protein n=1 Tax=Jeotgalibacillus marinus TaxID=86667 RepID=A0ABV3Q6E8_9BACL